MDRILFGDNQFFGINHMSLDKATELSNKYSTASSIFKTLRDVKEIGINTFMCTTHDRLGPVFEMMKTDQILKDMKIIPCMPYAHKYTDAVTDLGLVGGLQKYLPGGILSAGLRGAKTLLSNDFTEVMRLLVDSEMYILRGLNIEAIFLQNVMTDLLLGLNMFDFLKAFYDYVHEKYRVDVGFITMNYVYASDILIKELGLSDAILCSPVNKIGFRMNPSQKAVEACISQKRNRTIAMSIFASGAIESNEATAYIRSLDGVNSVLFGASSSLHIKATFESLCR